MEHRKDNHGEGKSERDLQREERLRKELALKVAREEARRKAEIIKAGRRAILTIVEEIMDEKVDEEMLIKYCQSLCKQDYEDVNIERSLIKICGYPLCYADLPEQSRKQYQISLARRKVYDISERKLFCSNLCYKASCYLKEQLEEEPFWMRSSNPTLTSAKIQIYSGIQGSPGAEVLLKAQIEPDEIEASSESSEEEEEKMSVKKQKAKVQSTFVASPYIKETDLAKFAESMSKLKIKEKK